ncbi:putative synaptobrevin protein [Stachybotrys elegans]|uniref:Synaptobrevin protein n=1 Tax=Stachybotrys elegans TaxID=80388 RepID=A0A8K0T1W0_9HYPO|nr:putative synaptobrevin protein [Stachybotrys elegans]
MARLSHVPYLSGNTTVPSTLSAELGQLLYRLQQAVLHPTPERERRLRTSEYERAKLAVNLDHARSLLSRLEQDALTIKAPHRRSEVQGTLNRQREILEQLLDRLEDYRKIAVEDDDDTDGEDILSEIIPTPSESMDSRSSDAADPGQLEETTPDPPAPEPAAASSPIPTQPEPRSVSPTLEAPTQTTQTLRSRTSAPSPQPTAHSTARAALFANRRKPATPQTSTATAEAILDNQRAEQDMLSESILKMAGALKASSQKFSTTLEEDKELLGRAGEGMEKTERSMEAARGRMGMLRRMTEGKGWWGRMILYAWVYGLMVGLVLLVFVMSKLRFG